MLRSTGDKLLQILLVSSECRRGGVMKNLIYYHKNKCDIYFKKITNKYERASKSQIYVEDIDKFNIKNCVVTFQIKDFLIKSLCMPLDNYIHERVINSLKFYFNSFGDDVLYDYFLLDSDIKVGQVRILLYAIKIQDDVQNVLKYIDKSYLVVRPLQFIILEYLTHKFGISKGIFLNKVDDQQYNLIIFKNSLILLNDYMRIENLEYFDNYLQNKIDYVKNEFGIVLDGTVHLLNNGDDRSISSRKFDFDFINYTMEEVLINHDYVRSKFSKFWKKKEIFKKNA